MILGSPKGPESEAQIEIKRLEENEDFLERAVHLILGCCDASDVPCDERAAEVLYAHVRAGTTPVTQRALSGLLRGMAAKTSDFRRALAFADAHVPQWERIIADHQATVEQLTFERDAADQAAHLLTQQLEDLRDDVLGDESLLVPEIVGAAGQTIDRMMGERREQQAEVERLTAEVERLRTENAKRHGQMVRVHNALTWGEVASDFVPPCGYDDLMDKAGDIVSVLMAKVADSRNTAASMEEQRDEALAEVSRLREQLAAQPALPPYEDVVDAVRAAVGRKDERDEEAVAAVLDYLRSRGVSSSEVEAPQQQDAVTLPLNWTEQIGWLFDVDEAERYTKVVRLIQMWQGLRDGTGDTDAEEAPKLPGLAQEERRYVRQEARSALSAASHQVLVFPHLKDWWAASCRDCAVTNYTLSREAAEDWKDQHEADTLVPNGVQPGEFFEEDEPVEKIVATFDNGLKFTTAPSTSAAPIHLEGRPSGSERLAPRPVAEYRCDQPAHSTIPCDRCEPIVDGGAKFLGDRWRQRRSYPRCTGISSDALALLGVGALDEVPRDSYPQDYGDLGACERTFEMAPPHIQGRMAEQLTRFREYVSDKWPNYEPGPEAAAQAVRSEATPKTQCEWWTDDRQCPEWAAFGSDMCRWHGNQRAAESGGTP